MNGGNEDSGDSEFCAASLDGGEIVMRLKPSRMLPIPSISWSCNSSRVFWKSKRQFVMTTILEDTRFAIDIVSSDSSPADRQRA